MKLKASSLTCELLATQAMKQNPSLSLFNLPGSQPKEKPLALLPFSFFRYSRAQNKMAHPLFINSESLYSPTSNSCSRGSWTEGMHADVT